MTEQPIWPDGKRFAFTIFDDTDECTIENVSKMYSLLQDLGMRTTKSVWPLRGDEAPCHGGATCQDSEYLNWIFSLRAAGFEIGYHHATFHGSVRAQTIAGLEHFHRLFGAYPKCMAHHGNCKEGIYWGNYRITGLNEKIYNLLSHNKHKDKFRGHILGDPFFWGDYCKTTVTYVRNFVFGDINTLKVCPYMPYHDPSRPYVNYWFASSEGPNVNAFNKTVSERHQDRLEEEGGACIMYAHLAYGFQENGAVQSRCAQLIKRLSQKNGWFVPVATLLDFLLQRRPRRNITPSQRARLERAWLWHKICVGGST